MSLCNLLEHSICFSTPLRLTPSAWLEHIPFGMFLIDLLRPDLVVELGTHLGVSYCAFCQAVNDLKLNTQCYAIDTWQGDSQAGFYDTDVLMDLKKHHDPLYSSFSRLIQSTFDDALNNFKDGSIDLLHIDGFHSYDEVKHDFESWLPRMSNRGVILFHDTHVREQDFGVWRLWEELKPEYPHFEFPHGFGLGVLGVGRKQDQSMSKLFREITGSETILIQDFFYNLGSRITALREIQEFKDRERDLQQLWTVRLEQLYRLEGVKGVVKKAFTKLLF